MKKTCFITYRTHLEYYYNYPEFCLDFEDSDIKTLRSLDCCSDFSIIPSLIETEAFDIAFSIDDLEIIDVIYSLRLRADILEKLSKVGDVNVKVGFYFCKNTNKTTYKLLKYTGHVGIKDYIKGKLDHFCKSIRNIDQFKGI